MKIICETKKLLNLVLKESYMKYQDTNSVNSFTLIGNTKIMWNFKVITLKSFDKIPYIN